VLVCGEDITSIPVNDGIIAHDVCLHTCNNSGMMEQIVMKFCVDVMPFKATPEFYKVSSKNNI
jgi:hypothetical protein